MPDGVAGNSPSPEAKSADEMAASAREIVATAVDLIFAIGKRQNFAEMRDFSAAEDFAIHICSREFAGADGPTSAVIGDFCLGYRKYATGAEPAVLDRARLLIDAVSLRESYSAVPRGAVR